MEPELYRGQQVFVENFDVHGLNYLEQRFAVEVRGRVLVRRLQYMAGEVRLWGNRDGYELRLQHPDGWELPEDWKETGVVHPDCTCLGPLVTTSRGGRTYLATCGWSN